jgi:hypothetical protein
LVISFWESRYSRRLKKVISFVSLFKVLSFWESQISAVMPGFGLNHFLVSRIEEDGFGEARRRMSAEADGSNLGLLILNEKDERGS